MQLIKKERRYADYLFRVLTADRLKDFQEKIILACETKQFNYILKKIGPYFNNLTDSTVGESELFCSKGDTPLTYKNLRSSKNPDDVKQKKDINRILQKMQ
jgi:carbamate kinase